jgi:hypothetical protein
VNQFICRCLPGYGGEFSIHRAVYRQHCCPCV